MPEGNPLVAQAQSQTTAVTGIGIAESATDLANGISDGSWVEAGLGAVGTGLEVLSLAIDPVGTLLQYGVSWLIEHIQPLKEALDWLAGDPPVIQSFSETWANVAGEVNAVAGDLGNEAKTGTAGWTGDAADAYRGASAEQADALAGAASLAEGISTGVMIMGTVVAAVREIVRDLVAELVAKLITWALEAAATLGFGTPVIAAQATAAISKAVSRISDLIRKLVKTISNVSPLIKKVITKLDEIIQALAKLGRKIGGGGSTTPSGASATPNVDAPTVKSPDGGTTPSGTTTPSGSTTPDTGAPGGRPDGGTAPSSTDGGSGPGDAGGPRGDGAKPDTTKNGDGSLRGDAQNPRDRSQEPVGRCGRKEPIDAATGEMFLVQTDVELPGLLPLVLERVHVSSYRAGRLFGRSWASTLDQRLEFDQDGVCYAGPAGVILVYPAAPDGGEVLPVEGARWPLARTSTGDYTISQPELGRTLHFAAPTRGTAAITAVVDRNGHRIDFGYDERGTVTEVVHSGGYQVGVDAADGLVRALWLRQPEGADITLANYVYDDARRLVAVVNSSGRSLRFEYDHAGRIVRWEDRNGRWYGYHYDEHGRCVRTEGTGNAMTGTFDYDPGNRITVETDSLGARTIHQFDEYHQLIRQVDPLGGELTQTWAGHQRLRSRTDQLGRVTRYEHDEAGNVISTTYPDGTRTVAEFNEFHLPIRAVQPDGATWHYGYDARGNLTAVIDPAGAVTRYGRDEQGRLESVTDALGNVGRVRTDMAGLPVTLTDPLGGTTRITRDQFGRITAITDPVGGVTRFSWTVEGQLLSRTYPDGAIERWNYDTEGNQVEYIDRLGQVTRTDTTSFDLPASELRPDGARLQFSYDTELRLTAVVNPEGLVWRYEYDAAGNLVRETDFNGRVLTYRHDAAGQLIERVNGAGETVQFVRDLAGNVIERRSADETATFEFDAMGNLVRATNADAELVLERDVLGRVLTETVNGRTVSSTFDVAGNRIARRTPTGAESHWEYDASGRPTALRTAGRTLTFGHDPAGREVERLLDTGTILAQVWDANHRLTAQTVSTVAGTAGARNARVLQSRQFHYRADGHVSAVEDQLSGLRRFELDAAGRVTSVQGPGWQERYAYDVGGNITAGAWPYEGAEPAAQGAREYTGTLLRGAGNDSYRHDEQGRLVLRRRTRLSRKPDIWRYTWNADDRLVAVVTPDGSHWRYCYDPLGRRIAKQRLDSDGSVSEEVTFVWDDRVLAEQTHSSGTATTWEWATDGFRPLAQSERVLDQSQEWVDREFYSIVTDLVGTPSELVDPAGNVAWHARGTLWGEQLGAFHQQAYTPLRLPGQYFDPETGLNYNYYRYYDPGTGRYGSSDPLGLAGGLTPHSYVDNPLSWIDPLGLTGSPAQGCGPPVSRQKQDRHVGGTSEYQRRLANGTPTSYFNSRAEADAYAQHAWQNGTPVPGRPGVRDYEYNLPVGRGPNGGWQTQVRVHMDSSGNVHAHPKGREYH